MATTARGKSSVLSFREQSAFGSSEAMGQAAKWVQMPFISFTPEPTSEFVASDIIDGSGGALPSQLASGIESHTWGGRVPIGFSSLGYWLKTMFGAPVYTDGTTHDQHQFRTGASPAQVWASVHLHHPDIGNLGYRLGSAQMTEITFDSSKEAARASCEIRGIAAAHGKFTSVPDSAPIVFASDTVPMKFEGKVQKDGVDLAAAVTGIRMSCRSGVTLDHALMNGLATPGDFLPGVFEVDGEISLRVQDATFYDIANAETLVSLKATWALGTDDRCIVTCDDVRLALAAPRVDGIGPVSERYTFRADKPTSSSKYSMEVLLRNQLPNYNRA